MMEEKRMKVLMDATGGIRDEFIEEAAVPVRKKRVLLRVVSAAAVLALLISVISLLQPGNHTESIPFFAIRAYATDGSVKVLDEVGENVQLQTKKSYLYPGKDVYIIDISLDDYDGDIEDLDLERVWVHHKGRPAVKPGEKRDNMALQWLSVEEDGMFGLRVIGWCEDNDYISLHIWDKDGMVICDKHIRITQDNGYTANVRRSFVYREAMTTDELIDATFKQDYTIEILVSSGDLRGLLRNYCGFKVLETRPDAASKMLERYERIVNGEEVHTFPVNGYESLGIESHNNDNLIWQVLKWPEFWKQLTEEEKERYRELVELEDAKSSQVTE